MITGRCECAAVKYQVQGELKEFCHCHCSTQPEPLRGRDRPFGRFEVAAHDSEQRSLAGSVGADQTVPLPGIELERHAGEERAVAEGFGDVGDGEHGERM